MTETQPAIKSSRYNSFINLPESGKLLGYNGISTLAVEFPISEAESIKKILDNPNAEYTGKDLVTKLTLFKGGFLIYEPIDELAFLKVKNRQERFYTGSAGYTVLLTKDCNLRCPYCYQEREQGVMPDNVIDAFLNMVERDSRDGKPISVGWFGGEPLLYVDMIFKLSKKLKKIAKKNKAKFHQSMISNGYMMTPKVSKQLGKMGCSFVQITVDGSKEIHDSKRVLAGGKPTFERIVEHAKAASDHMRVSLRVNIDKDNYDCVDNLLDELEEREVRGKTNLYFARIQEVNEFCADVSGMCFGAQDFSKWETRFEMKKIERGWGLPFYPTLKGGFCTADSIAGKVVCPDGMLVKCWNDVSSPTEAVGYLVEPQITEAEMMRNRLKWLAWDPFEKSGCLECSVLPNCMGGCPYAGLRAEDQTKGECSLLKYNLGETIALIYYHERVMEEIRKKEAKAEAPK